MADETRPAAPTAPKANQNESNESVNEAPEAGEGVTYTKPTSQLDLEERLKDGNEVERFKIETIDPADQVNEDGYVGTDPVYQNHAEDTHKPLAAEGGADAKAEKLYAEATGN